MAVLETLISDLQQAALRRNLQVLERVYFDHFILDELLEL